MHRVAKNATDRDTLNYSIVDDLAQSHTTMSPLEVLKYFPLQRKELFSMLGVIDPSDFRMITFDLDQGEPKMPSFISFQVPFTIQNLVIHQCIIDEGASTYVM